MVVLSFVGNIYELTNKELIEIKKLPYINGVNKSEINVALVKNRIDWNKLRKLNKND